MTRLLATQRVFLIILILGLFAMAAREVRDPDVWWHLRAGQQMLASHHVLHRDSFSFTRLGAPWVAHEWLSEVIFYLTFRLAGWAGLSLLFAAVIAGTFLILYRQCPGRPYLAGLLVALGAVATLPSWGVRPQMFTMLLAALFLMLLSKAEHSDPAHLRFLWWMPALLLLWVNLHGGFLLGPALIAAVLAGWATDAGLGRLPWPEARSRLRQLALVLLVCVAVIPLNPNGFELYRYPFQTLGAHTIVDLIVEWASPNFHSGDIKPFLGLLLLTWAAVAVRRKRLSAAQIFLLLATAYAALTAGRHIPIFVLVAVPILAESAEELAKRWNRLNFAFTPAKSPPPAKLAVNLLLLAAMGIFLVLHVRQALRNQASTEAKYFPVAATEFLIRQHPPAPLFNYYDWGGYFIAKLYPQYHVFIDGRTDLYGRLMDASATTMRAQDDWRKTLDQYHVRTVVIPPGAALAGVLRLDPAWSKVFEDRQAVIFVRQAPAS